MIRQRLNLNFGALQRPMAIYSRTAPLKMLKIKQQNRLSILHIIFDSFTKRLVQFSMFSYAKEILFFELEVFGRIFGGIMFVKKILHNFNDKYHLHHHMYLL